ncbi:signal peptidase I [Clostridium sp. CAG:524]|jgi:signal peptidase|nr:signal peptidase I [Clostridium sp. CAG:524]
MKKVIKKILNILKIIILILLILFALFTVYQKVFPNNPSAFGFRTYSIITKSMEPVLKKGDVILVQERNTSSYKVGDIITFKGTSGDLKGKIVTHEIVGIKLENGKNIFYTKGIQNISEDPAVYEDEILGKYIYKFKFFSLIERIMDTKIGFILIIIIPLGYIYFYEIRDIIKDIKNIKNKE